MKRWSWIAACAVLAGAGCQDRAAPSATGATDDDVASAQTAGGEDAAASVPAAPVTSAPEASAASSGDGVERMELTSEDDKLATGQFYEAYPIDPQPGSGLQTTMTASFAPVIMLLDAEQQKVSESEGIGGPGPDGNYQLVWEQDFPEGGRHFLVFTSKEPGATGTYTLETKRLSYRKLD